MLFPVAVKFQSRSCLLGVFRIGKSTHGTSMNRLSITMLLYGTQYLRNSSNRVAQREEGRQAGKQFAGR